MSNFKMEDLIVSTKADLALLKNQAFEAGLVAFEASPERGSVVPPEYSAWALQFAFQKGFGVGRERAKRQAREEEQNRKRYLLEYPGSVLLDDERDEIIRQLLEHSRLKAYVQNGEIKLESNEP